MDARFLSVPKMASLMYDGDQDIRFFRDEIADKSQIRSMVFGGYQKCLYPLQKFDSDSERIFLCAAGR